MTPRRPFRPDVAMKAVSRLGQVDVCEAFIEAGRGEAEVYGLWESPEATGTGRPRITINPSWHVVKTLIHEALHELHPEWSERAVRSQTTKVMNTLSPEQVWAIYEEYRRRVGGD